MDNSNELTDGDKAELLGHLDAHSGAECDRNLYAAFMTFAKYANPAYIKSSECRKTLVLWVLESVAPNIAKELEPLTKDDRQVIYAAIMGALITGYEAGRFLRYPLVDDYEAILKKEGR